MRRPPIKSIQNFQNALHDSSSALPLDVFHQQTHILLDYIYIYKRTSSWKIYSASICKSSKNRGREMATMLSIALMLSAAFFMGCTNLAVANYGDASAGVIHVGGQVLCQNCFKSYKEWVNGSNPLKGIN